jgi:hypothetical protein
VLATLTVLDVGLRVANGFKRVVSALRVGANFGSLLHRVEDERRSLVIENRGAPKAVRAGSPKSSWSAPTRHAPTTW